MQDVRKIKLILVDPPYGLGKDKLKSITPQDKNWDAAEFTVGQLKELFGKPVQAKLTEDSYVIGSFCNSKSVSKVG